MLKQIFFILLLQRKKYYYNDSLHPMSVQGIDSATGRPGIVHMTVPVTTRLKSGAWKKRVHSGPIMNILRVLRHMLHGEARN